MMLFEGQVVAAGGGFRLAGRGVSRLNFGSGKFFPINQFQFQQQPVDTEGCKENQEGVYGQPVGDAGSGQGMDAGIVKDQEQDKGQFAPIFVEQSDSEEAQRHNPAEG